MKINIGKKFGIPAVLIPLLFIHCGKKMPLQLEPLKVPGMMAGFNVLQEGDDLVFSWKFPEMETGGKTSFDPSLVQKIYFEYSDKPFTSSNAVGLSSDPGESRKKKRGEDTETDPAQGSQTAAVFLKKSRTLDKIPFSEASKDQEIFRHTLGKISGKYLNKQLYIAAFYTYKKVRSRLSDIREIRILSPVKPVENLELVNENKMIRLNWPDPSGVESGKKDPPVSGYNVYRMIESGKEPDTLSYKKINAGPVVKTSFEDKDTGVSGTYSYYVSAMASETNISKRSNIVRTKVQDKFPPEIPANLHIFRSEKGLMISWGQVPDKDLSHFRVYRKENEDQPFTMVADNLKTNSWQDNDVKPGTTYFYSVTSVDQNGNESDNSGTVSERHQ